MFLYSLSEQTLYFFYQQWQMCRWNIGGVVSLAVCSHPSCPLACDCPAMASMMASCEYMLIGVLYCAWTMVAFPPGPLTSMGLWVERAESFRAMGLKLGVYSTLSVSGWRRIGRWVEQRWKVNRLKEREETKGVRGGIRINVQKPLCESDDEWCDSFIL